MRYFRQERHSRQQCGEKWEDRGQRPDCGGMRKKKEKGAGPLDEFFFFRWMALLWPASATRRPWSSCARPAAPSNSPSSGISEASSSRSCGRGFPRRTSPRLPPRWRENRESRNQRYAKKNILNFPSKCRIYFFPIFRGNNRTLRPPLRRLRPPSERRAPRW